MTLISIILVSERERERNMINLKQVFIYNDL
jgi:hypothetical protein